MNNIPSFYNKVKNKHFLLSEEFPSIMQINLGSLCNLTCSHCHVNGGPNRKNNMTKETLENVIKAFKFGNYSVIDITGGAPEMNDNFRWFLKEIKKYAKEIIVRTNLVVLLLPKYKDITNLYKEYKVHIIASLPYYNEKVVSKQRGEKVFPSSIKALKMLNKMGFGIEPYLKLDLVYNPNGAFLPPKQENLEKIYKKKLYNNFEIVFNNLFVFTNNPIGRFSEFLNKKNLYESYINKLYNSYNEQTVENIMCRFMISVGPDGRLFDCDFNYIENITINGKFKSIFDLVNNKIGRRRIQTSIHCYGCTAGAGSS